MFPNPVSIIALHLGLLDESFFTIESPLPSANFKSRTAVSKIIFSIISSASSIDDTAVTSNPKDSIDFDSLLKRISSSSKISNLPKFIFITPNFQ